MSEPVQNRSLGDRVLGFVRDSTEAVFGEIKFTASMGNASVMVKPGEALTSITRVSPANAQNPRSQVLIAAPNGLLPSPLSTLSPSTSLVAAPVCSPLQLTPLKINLQKATNNRSLEMYAGVPGRGQVEIWADKKGKFFAVDGNKTVYDLPGAKSVTAAHGMAVGKIKAGQIPSTDLIAFSSRSSKVASKPHTIKVVTSSVSNPSAPTVIGYAGLEIKRNNRVVLESLPLVKVGNGQGAQWYVGKAGGGYYKEKSFESYSEASQAAKQYIRNGAANPIVQPLHFKAPSA